MKFGRSNRPITWSKICDYDAETELWLCDHVVRKMPFSDNNCNEWEKSNIRAWLNGEFYNSCFDNKERKYIVSKGLDYVFLLSVKEYEEHHQNIKSVESDWWLRSLGNDTDSAMYVNPFGSVNYLGDFVNYDCNGVRPAILMKKKKKITMQKLFRSVKKFGHGFAVSAEYFHVCDCVIQIYRPICVSEKILVESSIEDAPEKAFRKFQKLKREILSQTLIEQKNDLDGLAQWEAEQ